MMGKKLNVSKENGKIIPETEVIPSELFVSASLNSVDKVLKISRNIDEAKIKRLLSYREIK